MDQQDPWETAWRLVMDEWNAIGDLWDRDLDRWWHPRWVWMSPRYSYASKCFFRLAKKMLAARYPEDPLCGPH